MINDLKFEDSSEESKSKVFFVYDYNQTNNEIMVIRRKKKQKKMGKK